MLTKKILENSLTKSISRKSANGFWEVISSKAPLGVRIRVMAYYLIYQA